MARYQSYFICTSPRSGSTLLCSLLRGTGIAGSPESYFHAPSLSEWLNYFGLNAECFETHEDALKAVVAAAIQHGKNGTDTFGLRLQQGSFDYFRKEMKALHPDLNSDVSRINAAFGQTLFIYLDREDKLDQAISYVKAAQTGLWHVAPDGTEVERLSPPKEPRYDGPSIAAQIAVFEDMKRKWEDWFTTERISPLHISYDALSRDPSGTLAHILKALGLPASRARTVVPQVAKLADERNTRWAERYRSEAQKR